MRATPIRHVGFAVVALATALRVGVVGQAEPQSSASPSSAVAIVGETTITATELDTAARERLTRLRNEEYTIRKQVLDDQIERILLKKEADTRSVSVAELIGREVDAKVAPVTDAEKRAVYDGARSRFAGMSDAQAFARIESELKQSRVSEARRRFVSGLRTAAGVKILLEPPRVIVDTAGAPLKGSPSAPVTIVEFSDFQCPYCREATQTLKRLEQQYGNKVRVVFRDFPLPMHKDAPKASEAAACANEQGQFWPMHDKLFENQSSLQVPDLKRRAADIGLNTSRFDDCLDSGKYAGEWQRNRAIGQRYGVSATPTFFINGRMVLGALPFQAFTEIVDDEFGRSITRAAER